MHVLKELHFSLFSLSHFVYSWYTFSAFKYFGRWLSWHQPKHSGQPYWKPQQIIQQISHRNGFYTYKVIEKQRDFEKTYHHLSSEELGDGSLNTSAFHFVFHIVKKLEHTTTHSTPIIILRAYIYTPTLFKRPCENSPLYIAPVHHVAWSYLVFPIFTQEEKQKQQKKISTDLWLVTMKNFTK